MIPPKINNHHGARLARPPGAAAPPVAPSPAPRRLILWAVASAAVCLLLFWVAFFFLRRQTAAPAPAHLVYTLLGDPAWVSNRVWQENTALRQISHPDWFVTFVLPPAAVSTAATASAGAALDSAAPPTFYLDKSLDDFVLTWSQAVRRRQWQQLWALSYPPKTANLTLLEVTPRLNSWTSTLAARQLVIEDVNFYLPLAVSTAIAPTPEITAVWAVKHANGSRELVTTALRLTWDAAAATYFWDFNLASLPLFDE